MQPIMISRVTHVLSFTEVLQTIGAPVERELQRVGLPTMLMNQPDAYIPVMPALKFIKRMEHAEGIDDIAFLASQQFSFDCLSEEFIKMCQSVPSLFARLQLFSDLAPLENSYNRVSLIREEKDFRICFNLLGHPRLDGLHYSEWLQINGLVAIVQKTLKRDWRPTEITFQSLISPCDAAFEKFPDTCFLFGQKDTSITVPITLMSRSLSGRPGTRKSHEAQASKQRLPARPRFDFPGSLKSALQSYLQDGYPDINLAAEIANTSVRTLQRRLAQFGLSYSRLVQQTRFEVAVEMLKDPGIKSLDVASAVGYEDSSHFARAFRRIAGVSPTEYRRQQDDG